MSRLSGLFGRGSARTLREGAANPPPAMESLETRMMCYANETVHRALTESGVALFDSQFVQSELGRTASYKLWVREGAFNEDVQYGNPFNDEHPYFRHFWGDSRALGDGLYGYDSAPERAIEYFAYPSFPNAAFPGGGIENTYASHPVTAYWLLGHAAHLVQDMTVPAHVHNDQHQEGSRWLPDDPDQYHDWVDGSAFSTTGVGTKPAAAFDAPAAQRWLRWTAAPDSMLRSVTDLGGTLGDFSQAALVALFTSAAELADDYDSRDYNGDVDAGTRRNNSGAYNTFTEAELNEEAAVLVPKAIISTAELVRLFYGTVDGEKPDVFFSHLNSTDAAHPQSVQGSTLDLTAFATDQDTGDSGIGIKKFVIEYAVQNEDGSWGATQKVDSTSLTGEAVTSITGLSEAHAAFNGKHGAKATYRIAAEEGKTYRARVTTEDGAGNKGDSEYHYVRVGGDDIDLVLVIDTTGSMSDDISAVKQSATAILHELGDRNPGFRVSVVLYKDFGDAYVTKTLVPFTNDVTSTVNSVQSISVGGGGDEPEAVYSALHHAFFNLDGMGSWRGGDVAKRVILFGDAPPHDPEPNTGYTLDSISQEAYEIDPADVFTVVIGYSSSARSSFENIAEQNRGAFYNPSSASEVVSALTSAVIAASLPQVSVAAPSASEGFGGSQAVFTVRLSTASSETVTLSYETSDGTAIAAEDYVAGSGTITFAPGETSKTVAVRLLGDLEEEPDETFTLSLHDASGATIPSAASHASGTIRDSRFTRVAFGGKAKAVYTDASGDVITVALAGDGTGTVYLPEGQERADAAGIVIENASAKTVLSIAGKGKAQTSVGDVVISGGPIVKAVNAPSVMLTGRLSATGTVLAVTLAGLRNGGTIDLGASPDVKGATIKMGDVVEGSIVSLSPIKAITAGAWNDADGTADVIEAPRVDALTVKGNFQADLRVTYGGSLKSAAVGAVSGSNWSITGSADKIAAASFSPDFSAAVTGSVKSLSANSLSGSLSAATIGAVAVKGDLDRATLTSTGDGDAKHPAIATVKVGGAIRSSTVRSTGSVGAVSAAGMADSRVLVGVTTAYTAVPESAGAFANTSTLGTLTISGSAAGAFSRSIVMAPTITAAKLGGVDPANGGARAGLAARNIKSYTHARTKLANLAAPGHFDASGDYGVHILG